MFNRAFLVFRGVFRNAVSALLVALLAANAFASGDDIGLRYSEFQAAAMSRLKAGGGDVGLQNSEFQAAAVSRLSGLPSRARQAYSEFQAAAMSRLKADGLRYPESQTETTPSLVSVPLELPAAPLSLVAADVPPSSPVSVSVDLSAGQINAEESLAAAGGGDGGFRYSEYLRNGGEVSAAANVSPASSFSEPFDLPAGQRSAAEVFAEGMKSLIAGGIVIGGVYALKHINEGDDPAPCVPEIENIVVPFAGDDRFFVLNLVDAQPFGDIVEGSAPAERTYFIVGDPPDLPPQFAGITIRNIFYFHPAANRPAANPLSEAEPGFRYLDYVAENGVPTSETLQPGAEILIFPDGDETNLEMRILATVFRDETIPDGNRGELYLGGFSEVDFVCGDDETVPDEFYREVADGDFDERTWTTRGGGEDRPAPPPPPDMGPIFGLRDGLRGFLNEKHAVRLHDFYFAADDSRLRGFHLEHRANLFGGDEGETAARAKDGLSDGDDFSEFSANPGFAAFADSGFKKQDGGRTTLLYNKLTAIRNFNSHSAIYAQGISGRLNSEIYRNADLRGFAAGVFADRIFSRNDSYHLRIESPFADKREAKTRMAIDARIGEPTDYFRIGVRRNLEDKESAANIFWLRIF